jgi:Ca2+-binding EF-hand superfamily protein
MGLKHIRSAKPSVLAVLVVGCMLLAGAPHAAAQSFGGMSMLDLEAARDSFFQSADHDGDFALSNEELLSAMGAAHSGLFECWDEDGDGLCTYGEFLDSGTKVFTELDMDGDGRLSPEEVQ